MYRIHLTEYVKAFGSRNWTEAYETFAEAASRVKEIDRPILVSEIVEVTGDIMENVEIQLQNMPSGNWVTMRHVVNQPWIVLKALEQLKDRFPKQSTRAMLNGALIQML